VHARLIASGIQDFPTLIDHISQCLRPGGLMELVDYDFRVYDGSGKPFSLPASVLHPPYFAQWMSLFSTAVRQRGGSPDAAAMLHNWTLQHPAFEDVVHEHYFIPTAPFISPEQPNHHVMRTIAEYLREDMLAFLRAGRPLLLGSGVPEYFLNELQRHAELETKEARTVTYMRLDRVYARKRS